MVQRPQDSHNQHSCSVDGCALNDDANDFDEAWGVQGVIPAAFACLDCSEIFQTIKPVVKIF
jgi:hypothetical protein